MLEAAPEHVYYSDGLVWVTDKRVVFHRTSYGLGSFDHAQVRSVDPIKRWLGLLFCCAMICAYLPWLYLLSTEGSFMAVFSYGFSFIFLVLLIAALSLPALVLLRRSRLKPSTVYYIRLGKIRRAFASVDEQYVLLLVQQINAAKRASANGTVHPTDTASKDGSSEDHVYFRDAQVTIASDAIMAAGQRYKTGEIKKPLITQMLDGRFQLFIGLGLLLQLVNGYLTFARDKAPNNGRDFYLFIPNDAHILVYVLPLAFMALIIVGVVSLFLSLNSSPTYFVALKLGSSKAEILATTDKDYAEYIAARIREAIQG